MDSIILCAGQVKGGAFDPKMYATERQAKGENLSPEQIKDLRLAGSLLVIDEMGKWIFAEIKSRRRVNQTFYRIH